MSEATVDKIETRTSDTIQLITGNEVILKFEPSGKIFLRGEEITGHENEVTLLVETMQQFFSEGTHLQAEVFRLSKELERVRLNPECLGCPQAEAYSAYMERAMLWKPIAEAPKDGTHVALWLAGKLYIDCRWNGISQLWEYSSNGWGFVAFSGEPTYFLIMKNPEDK